MKASTLRARIAGAVTLALVGGLLAAGPAIADDPPPIEWTALSGYPITVDGLTITVETGLATASPWGLGADDYLEPVPYIRADVVNESEDETRYFSAGISMFDSGVIDRLWDPTTWYGDPDEGDDSVAQNFVTALGPGQSLQADTSGEFLAFPVPIWSGRTYVLYELDAEPTAEDPSPGFVELARFTDPGRFVPIRFELEDPDIPVPIGRELEIAGTGAASELFPGVTATVEASGLVPGEELELWLAKDFDYFFFFLLGGALPVGAVQVGEGTVAADGTLTATFDVAPSVPIGEYQVVAGVPGERYWPAGSYRSFSITEPQASASFETPAGESSDTVSFEVTQLTFTFPAGTTAGTTTAAVSTTGPERGEFTFAGSPPLYYHLDTTAVPGGLVEVCVTYDAENIPGDPPRLYHLEPYLTAGYTWRDITTRQEPGYVCGETSSFSPFTLGYPVAPPDDGSVTVPAKGVLHSDNGWDTGLQDGDYNVVMNIWWGVNARIVRLYEGPQLIATKVLTPGSPNAQQAIFPVSGRANGTYVYKAELENSRGITTTQPITVKVTQADPAKPVLSHDNRDQDGVFTLTADLWWGTNATSYVFYEGTTVLGQGVLTAKSPSAQKATVSLTGVPKGTHTYRVQFSNAAGTTSSANLAVKVAK